VFNVGDSRVYRFADGAVAQLTTDHTEVAELVAAGDLTEEEARGHPLGNVLTRALGIVPAPEPDIEVFAASGAERFLICSDGLTLELDDAAIAAVLAATPDPAEAAERLVAAAVAAGGRDNVTAVVVDRAG
jgi:PPM family protein phosphatase